MFDFFVATARLSWPYATSRLPQLPDIPDRPAFELSFSARHERGTLIVLGAVCYQWLIAPVQGEPAAISKLNTACQLGMLFFTLTAAAFGWPPPVSLMVLGATVVFTSIVSGLTYVLRWGSRAWRVAHGAP